MPRYEVFVSELVIDEMRQGDPDAADRRIESAREFKVLRVTNEARELARTYLGELPLFRDAEADAVHLSLAVLAV
ncbi:MAG: hypothetical protein HUU46_22370 [Candidatus Hydrogenedentes bacterium]|nr:hypothetical protein [Candidatus Hydrogenedentota bacterium]